MALLTGGGHRLGGGQPLAEQAARLVDAPGHCTLGNLEDLGNLFVRELFDRREHERHAQRRRQLADGLEHALDLGAMLRLLCRIRRMLAERLGPTTDVSRLCAALLRERRAALAAAQRIERGVHGDAIEPREEVSATIERLQAAKRAHERLLRRVVGIAVITENMESSGVHASLMASDKTTEGFAITIASPIEIGVLVSH